jgi:exonuclease VII small subunit
VLATGEFVCLFHQDDVMLPGNLEQKVHLLTADAALSFVHSAAEMLLEDSAPTTITNWVERADRDFIEEGASYFRKLFFHGNIICAPAVMARRQRLLDLGGFDEELGYAPDYEMWMKGCVEGRVGFLCQPLIQYRWHNQNASLAYRCERGVEEMMLARRRAVQYYVERTGRQEDGEIFADAVTALARLERWSVELERGKRWLEEQKESWRRQAQVAAGEIQKQQTWIAELERGKAWLEEQRGSWQRVAEERQRVVQEQQARIAELERGKAWLEEQWRSWQERTLRWQKSAWVRLGLRLGIVNPAKPVVPEAAKERTGDRSNKS